MTIPVIINRDKIVRVIIEVRAAARGSEPPSGCVFLPAVGRVSAVVLVVRRERVTHAGSETVG